MSGSANTKSFIDRESVDRAILDAVSNIRFGSVEIVVHDSEVVQIECKEKFRFESRRNRD
jgi:hypothetical protein